MTDYQFSAEWCRAAADRIAELEQRLAAAEAAMKAVDDAIAYWGVERSQTTLERIETALNKYEAAKGGRDETETG